MINLIKNELTKIFKKKSIYITLIITFGFIILCNFMYQYNQAGISFSSSVDIDYYEKYLASIDINDKHGKEEYVSVKTELDSANLVKKYGGDNTWQARIIYSQVRIFINQMNDATYNIKNEQKYQAAQKQYNELIAKLDLGDWHYFVKEEIKQVEKNLLEQTELKQQTKNKSNLAQIEEQLADLEIEKQVLNWRLEKEIPYGNDYKNGCLANYQNAKSAIREYENANENHKEEHNNKKQYYGSLETAAIAKYDIEHGTTAGNTSNARGILLDSLNQFELFIIIMIIMIAGTIISEEFNKGTIKLLLIKPYKRTTILAAKFITCILLLIMIIIIVILMQYVIGGIIQGFSSFKVPAVVYNHNTNQIQEVNIIAYMAMQTLGKLPIYLLLMTLTFAISTLFTNSALGITIGLLGYMGGPIINMLGLNLKLYWLKFFVTPNWDLSQYLFGGLPEFPGINLIFSIAIIAIYMLIMLVTTFIVFKKKNIKNI